VLTRPAAVHLHLRGADGSKIKWSAGDRLVTVTEWPAAGQSRLATVAARVETAADLWVRTPILSDCRSTGRPDRMAIPRNRFGDGGQWPGTGQRPFGN